VIRYGADSEVIFTAQYFGDVEKYHIVLVGYKVCKDQLELKLEK
jgi:hypothetical protein